MMATGSERVSGMFRSAVAAEGNPGPSGAYTVLSTGSTRHSAATRVSCAAANVATLAPLECPSRYTLRGSATCFRIGSAPAQSMSSYIHMRPASGELRSELS